MGKRTRKTRWRTLPIGDEHSDSEESNSTLDNRVPPTYHQKYYNKFTYSSQSTPTRRYQSDGTKSTRSSSTASENKITFNEDEYTKITTPRQDVLFKKGYLNKPKTYSTQTSTGNSTTSTGNSTGNGTPDYQSTDLEYESQFVFPNGFLDQNGIYYVNSYDPYPLMIYNAPTYYSDENCGRTKKFSTELLTESASTSNEETSQEAASSANQNGVGHGDDVQHATPPPHVNGHHHHHPQHHMPPSPAAEYGQVYNVVYPGFYYNGLCPPQEIVNCQDNPSETKRIKRRRRRKLPLDSAKTDGQTQNGTTSEYTEDEFSSVEEEDEQANDQPTEESDLSVSVPPPIDNQTNENSKTDQPQPNVEGDVGESQQVEVASKIDDEKTTIEIVEQKAADTNMEEKKVKYDLKPDAQEFVPRSMRPENLQFIKIQPGFMPVPMMTPNFGHPAFLPAGVPVGYIQPNPAMYPGYIPGYLPAYPDPMQTVLEPTIEEIPQMEVEQMETKENKGDVDIRTVVSKLEEVVNDSQIPENRNLTNGFHPMKKPGQYKNYEERKKFFGKNNNNKNVQNGHYQKRHKGRYQTTNQNENGSSKHEETNENTPSWTVTEDASSKSNKNFEDVAENSTSAPLTSNGTHESIGSTVESNSVDAKSAEMQQKETTVLQQNRLVREETEILNSSPKFQQKPLGNSMIQSPSTPNRDNHYGDSRNGWPRRDGKVLQKRDQPDNRSNQAYKQNGSPIHRFNKKFTPNSPVRKQTATQTTYYSNENSRRYSETVKKSPQPLVVKQVVSDNSKSPQQTKPVTPEVTNTPINPTQWISVSNKKKKRSKNIEDSDNGSDAQIFEEEDLTSSETQEHKIEDFQKNAFLQNMLAEHSKVEESQSTENDVPDVIRKSPVKILEVRDLEKELLGNVGVEIKEENEAIIAEVKIIEETKQKSSSRRKQKKGGQKQPTKRVFITDLDISQLLPEVKKEESEMESKEAIKTTPEEVPKVEEIVQVEEIIQPEQTEKKKKKKKKKNVDIASSTPTVSEDTYDLLLENTFSSNSEEKTNMEISQELDLIIQRGMYSNLEEKIKALNIIPIKEEFFQSVVRSSRESSTEKSPEYTKLLANSMPKFKYCMASVEDDVPKLNQPSTSLFVENLEVNEILNDIYGKEGTPEAEIGELVTRATPPKEIKMESLREKSIEKGEVRGETKNKEKLYPITQAVKNWMNKTRENTPEVEILKSPSKIFKEFCEIDEPTSNGNSNESDEEVTVYSASRNNSDAADLLDCWENEITSKLDRQDSAKESITIVDDEEVLEVYESKYGRNEDFLELQREIEEKKKQEQEARSRNFPKHGALPYRAICCNVM